MFSYFSVYLDKRVGFFDKTAFLAEFHEGHRASPYTASVEGMNIFGFNFTF